MNFWKNDKKLSTSNNKLDKIIFSHCILISYSIGSFICKLPEYTILKAIKYVLSNATCSYTGQTKNRELVSWL